MEDAEQVYSLGRECLEGPNTDHAKGAALLQIAADLGHAKAQYNLGICFHHGIGVKQSNEKAYHYFRLASEQDVPRANYMLGCYLTFGIIQSESESLATHYFRLAAESGIADAQYNLGVILLGGKLEEEAIPYFLLAAEHDHADAQYNLGICYYQGLGAPVSHEKAIHYLELAVKQKHPKAAGALEQVLMAPYVKK